MGMNGTSASETELVAVTYSDIPGWSDDRHGEALDCFRRSAVRMRRRPYSTKALATSADSLAAIAEIALSETAGSMPPRAFFEQYFEPWRVVPPGGSGFVTGYFEPEVEASPKPTGRFATPLYHRPPDLVDIDDATRPPHLPGQFMFARQNAQGISEYPDRASIERGLLAGRGLELAWIESPVDAFFIHVQGSARLAMPDGNVWRISYAAKTGHPFTPIGAWLVENGHLRREDVTMDSIRDWLLQDPERARQLMDRNRSYIFFQRTVQDDPALGPVAAAGVPLTPGRSLAIDHRLHTFGTPVYVATRGGFPEVGDWRRLMIAQDTGSAIVGPARGDIFMGSGTAAGSLAGQIKHAADFYMLVPRTMDRSR